MAVAQRQSNVSQCWDGSASCDRSKLSATELNAVLVAAHERNYLTCLTGPSGCRLSELTAAEANSIASVGKTASASQ
jgi:hypothetical protein